MVPQERLTPLLIILCAICLTVTGELFLKSGMNRVGPISLHQILSSLLRIAATPRVWLGFGFIALGAMMWLTAISRVPLSWAYPMLSLGYILILLFSRLALGEAVSPVRWIGTLVIVLGVYLVFRS